jgi:hypothetical protein
VLAAALLLAGMSGVTSRAYDTLQSGGQVRPELPQPADVFGFEPGTDRRLADFSQITEYFRRLDAASPRVQLLEIGQSTEGRRMFVAAISSEENLAALDRYRDIARRLADGRGLSDADARALAREGRTIAWLDMGLHATEVAHGQVSAEIARAIASDEGAEMRRIRDNVIVVLMPVMNPDGLDLVAKWYRSHVGTPFETSPLPVLYQKYGGHDNNRDWYMQNLVETRVVSRQLYAYWYPQLLYNHHQSGITSPRIWTPPMDDPVNPNMHPLVNRGISLLGVGIQQRLEQEGKRGAQGYSTYSNWWDGGMRSTPCFHNIVGILTEVASGRYATPMQIDVAQLPARLASGESARLPSTWNPSPWTGGTWRLRDQMDYMVTATMAYLRLAADHREDWLYNRYQMARDQVAAGRAGSPYAFVVPRAQHDAPTAAKLAQVLLDGAVEVHRATAPFTAAGKTYDAESLVILMAQPFRGYAKDLLEAQHHPDRRDGANGPPKRPYDMAGWTLPYQMGVQVDAIDAPFDASLERITEMPPVAAGEGAPDRRENRSATAVYRDLEARGRAPRIAVYQSWVASADEGWTRFVLEEFRLPYVSLHDQAVRAGHLRSAFDAIILPDQSLKDIVEGHAPGTMPAEYVGGIGEAGVAALKQFVEEGGTLVAFDGATDLPVRRLGIPVKNAIEGVPNTEFYCPGSLLRMDIATGNPLALGMPAEQAAFFVNGRAFVIDGNSPQAVATYAPKDLLMSGWINGEQFIAGKAAVVNAPLGRGRVVLFGFSPIFRGQPHGTFKLLFNALLEPTNGVRPHFYGLRKSHLIRAATYVTRKNEV